MYRLLLAEDENVFRNALLTMIDWKELDIHPPIAAKNGEDALQCIMEQQPDILITDIQMPQLSGLDLVKFIHDNQLHTICIILTGYNDFNYAQQALRCGVFDFVLKPCKPDEIYNIVQKAKTRLDDNKFKRETSLQLMQNWNANKGIVKEQTLSRWIHSSEESSENREKTIYELSLPIPTENIHVGIVRFLLHQENSKDYEERDMELLRFAAMNIVQETLDPPYHGQITVFRNQAEVIWVGDGVDFKNEVGRSAFEQIFENIQSYLHLTVTLCIGPVVPHLNLLHLSYNKASEVLEKSYFWGDKGIFVWDESPSNISPPIEGDSYRLTDIEKTIVQYLLTGHYAEALDELDVWLELLCHDRQQNKTDIHMRTFALLIELQKLATGRQSMSIEWKESTVMWVNQLPKVDTFWELSIILKKMIRSWVEAHTYSERMHRTIQAVLQIIHTRFHDNLSLESVAKEAFVSPTYLSGLFKQEVGMNFLDYLHHYRIEYSKQLLINPNLKIYTIAKQVGYRNERHFSETFKKWVGFSPSQLQKSLIPSN
jgi:two-component system response regulator YesN